MTTPPPRAPGGLDRGAFLRAAAVTALAPTLLARPADALAHGGRRRRWPTTTGGCRPTTSRAPAPPTAVPAGSRSAGASPSRAASPVRR